MQGYVKNNSKDKAIDVEQYTSFAPNGAHQEAELYFKQVPATTWKPMLSIIMANYNRARYIEQAIESVLNQTFKDWELIIVEDCSADNSLEIINQYLNDKRIRLIQHEHNRGYTAALKTGIANVRSEYFGILDSDDCLMPNAIATMYEYHIKHPRCGLIYSQFVACHENLWPRRIGYCGKIPIGKTNLEANLVSHFKTFKLCDYLKSLGYDEDILYAEDKDIIYKMEEVSQLLFVDQCMYLFRELTDSHGHDDTKARIGIQSWEKAKKAAFERRKRLRDKLLGPNAHVTAEKLLITENKGKHPEHKPEFSIIMANYNHAKYIGESIKSVLNQSFENWELIIVDDCSIYNSLEFIEPYLRDNRIRLVKHHQNKGYTAALKTAIAQVQSEYFGILDSDDCLTFDAVEVMYKEHIANPDCGFIYSQLQYCDEKLLPLRAGINKAVLPGRTSFDCDTISQFKTFKMSDYLKTEGYNEDILYAEDKDIIYKMEEVTKLRFVDKVLYLVRKLPDSICHSKNTTQIGRLATAKAKITAIKRRCATLAQIRGDNFKELFDKNVKEAIAKYPYDIEYYFTVLKNLVPILRKTLQNETKTRYLNVPENIMTCHIEDAALWFADNLDFIKVLEIIKSCDIIFDSPLVSVHILTNLNNRFIKRAIESVLTQNYQNLELLIIDDSDNTGIKEIIDCFQDPRIRYIRRPFRNIAETMNYAIIETKNEYIIRIEPDDYIEQNYIEKMVIYAEECPEIDYFYPAASTAIDEFDKPINQQNYPDFSNNTIRTGSISKLEYPNIPCVGSLIRKSLFAKAGLYKKSDTADGLCFLRRNAPKINFSRVDDNTGYFNRVIPEYLPKYNTTVNNSGLYQDYEFAQNHGFNNNVIIPNDVREEEFSQIQKLSFRQKYKITTKYLGLCVANFCPGNGQDRVIECVRQMNRTDFTMVFIGKEGGELYKLRQLASGLNIRFCEGLDREDTLSAYHEADIFLFCSEKNSSPQVIMEAKASRTPFVSTDCGNVRQWKGGVVCAPEKMAFYANRILNEEIIRRSFAEDGWKEWKEKLTWKPMTEQYEQSHHLPYHHEFDSNAHYQSRITSLQKITTDQKEYYQNKKNTVAIIFSKDRAMQLNATIESFLLHCTDNDNVDLNILYNTSTKLYTNQYDQLKSRFPEINFIRETDFRHQTLSLIEKNEYVLFLVDDNIFVKPFSIQNTIYFLQKEGDAIGFSLRLGKNTTYCYPLSSQQRIPAFMEVGEGILKYCWLNEQHDFGYPLEVSSSVYRSKDMLRLLSRLDFTNPNTLEGTMASNKYFEPNLRHLLTFDESVTFCNPVNIVQNVTNNKFGKLNNYTSKELADYFSQGKLIDVEKYIGFTPNASHQEMELYFIDTDIKKTYKPRFSIIMANYNNEKYIAEAIESVLNQTCKDWELIIVEDCSTDNSLCVIKKYINDKRIRLIQHEKNKGYTATLKTGVTHVKSEYFGIFDSDDCLVDNAIEIMYDAHVKNPDCGLIYSQYVKCNSELNPREIGHCKKIPSGKTNLETNVVSHFKTFKLHDYLKTSGYDEDILYAEDRDIAYKMEEVTDLLFVDKCLYHYRELPDSQGHNPRKRAIGMQTRQQAMKNAIKRRLRSCPDKLPAAVLQQINTPSPQSSKPQEILNSVETTSKQLPIIAEPGESLVSVIMPAYNAADYIKEAIESVLIQNYRNFELVVIDDGSTDNTKDIVASFKNDKIKYLYQENKGLAGAHNTGIKTSQGLFLIKLDSDDMMTPDFIARHLQEFEVHPEADLVYCDDCLIDENSKPIRLIKRPEYTNTRLLIRDLFRCGFPVVPFRTCIRRSVFDKIGFFDENLRMAEDYDMIRRFVEMGLKIQHLPGALYLRRMTPNSLSRNFTSQNAKFHFEVIRRFTDTFTYDELFPDVAWDEIAPGMRQLHAKCLTAGTYLALGQEYIKSNALEYSRTAFDRACSELNDCIKMDPKNQGLQQLLQKSKRIQARYTKAAQQAVTI